MQPAAALAKMNYEYIDTPEALGGTVAALQTLPLIAVDTEAAGYHRYLDRLSLIQLSSRDQNFLIDPLAIEDLSPLARLLEDRAIETLFHDADYDLRILDRDAGLRVEGLFDTQIAAAFLGVRSLGLGSLADKFLGINLPKAFQRADWGARPLSDDMKDYAAMDTAYLPELRDRLRGQLEERGRLAWAEEEFRRREETRWTEPADGAEAFMRMKGARDLPPRGLAILRELHGWREGVGEERDQSTFRIISNQALLEMAVRAPRDEQALGKIKGVSPAITRRYGDALGAAVRRGLDVPESELPRFPPSKRWERDPEVEARSERLRNVRNRQATELDLDPGFLISRAVLDEVARQNPGTPAELAAVPEVREWQVEAIGEPLLAALRRN